jgi:hypothetical protein
LPLFRRRVAPKPPDLDVSSAFDDQGRLRLQCWYCEEEIAYEGFDPCAVILVTNWAEESKHREQQFFAHADCFRQSGSGKDLYIFDDDFEQD